MIYYVKNSGILYGKYRKRTAIRFIGATKGILSRVCKTEQLKGIVDDNNVKWDLCKVAYSHKFDVVDSYTDRDYFEGNIQIKGGVNSSIARDFGGDKLRVKVNAFDVTTGENRDDILAHVKIVAEDKTLMYPYNDVYETDIPVEGQGGKYYGFDNLITGIDENGNFIYQRDYMRIKSNNQYHIEYSIISATDGHILSESEG